MACLAIALAMVPSTEAAEGTEACSTDYCAHDAVFQTAPLQALFAGVLESPVRLATGLEHGDFGLGGLSPLDGEVIVLDGKVYHARLDGSIREVDASEPTSILIIKHFRADRIAHLDRVEDLDDLTRQLDVALGFPNRIHAVRIEGRFDRLAVRSVPRQEAPYAPVTTVVQSQKVLELEDIEGTLVGFRFPGWAAGINAPGYHFHFVDADRQIGGHVLGIATRGLRVEGDISRAVTTMTPDDPLFDNANFDGTGPAYRRALRPGEDAGNP